MYRQCALRKDSGENIGSYSRNDIEGIILTDLEPTRTGIELINTPLTDRGTRMICRIIIIRSFGLLQFAFDLSGDARIHRHNVIQLLHDGCTSLYA